MASWHVNAPLSADTGSIAVRWIRKFYLSLIAVVICAMSYARVSPSTT